MILQTPPTMLREPPVQASEPELISGIKPIDLLIQDESAAFVRALSASATRRGFSVVSCSSFEESLRIASMCLPRICLVDVSWKMSEAASFLHSVKQSHSRTDVVLMTATPSIASAVTFIKAGASNYLPKSLGSDAILKAILNPEESPEIRAKPMNPERVYWEYVHLILHQNQGNISATARNLKMHRRTLQRILSKSAPPE